MTGSELSVSLIQPGEQHSFSEFLDGHFQSCLTALSIATSKAKQCLYDHRHRTGILQFFINVFGLCEWYLTFEYLILIYSQTQKAEDDIPEDLYAYVLLAASVLGPLSKMEYSVLKNFFLGDSEEDNHDINIKSILHGLEELGHAGVIYTGWQAFVWHVLAFWFMTVSDFVYFITIAAPASICLWMAYDFYRHEEVEENSGGEQYQEMDDLTQDTVFNETNDLPINENSTCDFILNVMANYSRYFIFTFGIGYKASYLPVPGSEAFVDEEYASELAASKLLLYGRPIFGAAFACLSVCLLMYLHNYVAPEKAIIYEENIKSVAGAMMFIVLSALFTINVVELDVDWIFYASMIVAGFSTSGLAILTSLYRERTRMELFKDLPERELGFIEDELFESKSANCFPCC
ncbi:MAG: hypothetical protein ACE365_03435 [Gammaproteobacteria bacterium]